MVQPLDTDKLAQYIITSKSFKDLKWKVETHRKLIELDKEGLLPNSGGKD